MPPHRLFAGDRAADLVEHRVHGTDVHDVSGQREGGELDAIAWAERAFEGDEDPGGEAAHRRLERPAQEHAAEHAERGAELAQHAEAVGHRAHGGDAGHEPVDACEHEPFDRRTLATGEQELGRQGEEGADAENERHDAREVEGVHPAGQGSVTGRPAADQKSERGDGEVGDGENRCLP